ncbi:MAG: spore germination protein [Lachnospiraceae bacterium]
MPNVSLNLDENIRIINEYMKPEQSFDLVYRNILVGERNACFLVVDGFCKDELMQKILQYLMDLKKEDLNVDMDRLLERFIPYVEVEKEQDFEKIETMILSGMFALFVDGFDHCILIDAREYPSRSIGEPDKDKALRGSKDGFVETLIFNTALIRRRIRSSALRMEHQTVGSVSKTDVVMCYMDDRVDRKLLETIRQRMSRIRVESLTMNQQSLAECLLPHKWINPFPKYRFTERPDTAAAQIMEGNVILLVDNSPQAIITPVALWDLMEEADDYYFPPITGTYLRWTRLFIMVINYLITPLYLLFAQHPEWVGNTFRFIILEEEVNIPIIWQFLMLEIAIDGLRLAAVNTPNMLSTPLSVMAALVLGEFAVSSGWFSYPVMLYMAFVAIAGFTNANYELGYAVKFMRIITLILTALFDVWGFIAGVIINLLCLAGNRVLGGYSYLRPLIPFHGRKLMRVLFRRRLKG